jgi:hypothetical protein
MRFCLPKKLLFIFSIPKLIYKTLTKLIFWFYHQQRNKKSIKNLLVLKTSQTKILERRKRKSYKAIQIAVKSCGNIVKNLFIHVNRYVDSHENSRQKLLMTLWKLKKEREKNNFENFLPLLPYYYTNSHKMQ